jgi:predicted RND superfamily exporter protein
MNGMEKFVQQVRSVDPAVTGNPLQIYEASRQMKRSYEQAAWYTLLGVAPVVFLHFRRLSHTLLAGLPLMLGLVQMFGLMGALDLPLNPANIIVLPFLLGIGMENGVHIIHDYRRQGSNYQQMSNSASLAVVINSLTTMVGFASLMIANHRGLQSLGRALTIGMSCCLMSALVMPNLLLLLRRKESREDSLSTEAAGAVAAHSHLLTEAAMGADVACPSDSPTAPQRQAA